MRSHKRIVRLGLNTGCFEKFLQSRLSIFIALRSAMFFNRLDMEFSNSLIIHQEKTKKITTVTVVWICDPNYYKILLTLALNFSKSYWLHKTCSIVLYKMYVKAINLQSFGQVLVIFIVYRGDDCHFPYARKGDRFIRLSSDHYFVRIAKQRFSVPMGIFSSGPAALLGLFL